MRRSLILLLVFVLFAGAGLAPSPARAQSQAPADDPTPLVPSGVTYYALAAPKVFWYTGVPPCPPAAPTRPQDQYTETFQRIPTYGGLTRTLYSELRNCDQGQVRSSNIAASSDFLYWLSPTGLVKLSTSANPGDDPQLVNALAAPPGEVADGGDRIYTIHHNTGGASTKVGYVRKDNNQIVDLTTPGNYAGNLQTDGEYVYYLTGGSLVRVKPGVDSGVVIANGVSGYYPEGSRLIFCTANPFKCYYTNRVYIGIGPSIYIYDNLTNTLDPTPIYTSSDSTARISSLATEWSGLLNPGRLFFIEARTIACSPSPCFPSYLYVVQRTGRGGGAADSLYTYGPVLIGSLEHLTTDNSFIFFQQGDAVLRLPNNAGALPVYNLSVTGMEVTQAIQNLNNDVRLIKKKRTFVRVYVRADGVAVPGVTAYLTAPGVDGTVLLPINPAGTHITIRPNPSRADIDQSFLFELPWSWTQPDSTALHVLVNPNKVPLETNYADDAMDLNASFQPSPKLSVELFRLNYTLGGNSFSPSWSADILKTYSWIQRAYPLGGAVGENFRPRLWDVDWGNTLGRLVDTTSPVCNNIFTGQSLFDDPALCASYYANGLLWSYRVRTIFGLLNVGLNKDSFYYGMISDASGFFPRGQAAAPLTSVGPTGVPGSPFNLGQGWDTDGTYGDWYAGHEIGHSLGRAHPNAGSDDPNVSGTQNCGHSRSDPGYPYGNTTSAAAPIGPADGSMEGFDVGDPANGISPAVLPSSIWNDVMSYCPNQWVSDYTYNAMYDYMIAHPSQPESAAAISAAPVFSTVPAAGDFLAVAGAINPGSGQAAFSFVSRLDSVVNTPALIPGPYSLRLLDAANNVLADHPFTPIQNDETGLLDFNQVVDFAAGTRTLQIVRLSDGKVAASQTVSPNPPAVQAVTVQASSSPVTGTITLSWTASDPDGGPLTFDVAYSRDNGVTFQPVAIGLKSSPASIDTASLGGSGTAVLRVIASDGVNLASADSAPFVMAPKPPLPFILSPGDNTHVHYGQLVNFSGFASDAQDGIVPETGLAWKDAQGNLLGSGALLSLNNLPVGANVITFEATNSSGLSASASVTVIVDDDLSLPGPTLTAGPAQVGWDVPAGSTQAQTAQVSIGNAGSGDLSWTASVDAPWLSLDVISGTVTAAGSPSMLTLTADPSGLAPDSTFTAHLTITGPAGAGGQPQIITIPVTLSTGDVYFVAPLPRRLFLPVVRG